MIPAHLICNGSSIKKDYPPTTLEPPCLPSFTHLRKSLINETILKINELVYALFKQKIKIDENYLTSLFRYFKIPIPKVNGTSLDLTEVKKPDFMNYVNIQLVKRLYKVINSENNSMQPEANSNYFKFYIGFGNNYPSVRQIVKSRSWWHRKKAERFIN